MSSSKNNDLLDFAKDIRKMSANNITPPDAAAPASKRPDQDTERETAKAQNGGGKIKHDNDTRDDKLASTRGGDPKDSAD
ncbi:hypothetical protein TWF696_005882 [Orbilia brochopaga]|uniref:Uncharacterized protein n=1 Tax=Orbilia brochopaga TaxID=3140254 RepID=A0AAV9UV51_9PEZI